MLKWIESTGKSEEAAIEAALQKLGMDRDEVSVEILERAKSGFLGIGSCPAKVKVSYEAPDEPEERPAPAEVTPAEAEPVKAAEHAVREEAPSPPPLWPRGEGGAHRRLSHRPAGPDGGRGQTRHSDG
ncbi:Jag N-terminal domain-containing protein [Flavonifractor plautii]|nr:Jag N-terminal domain-containing protein [Flavonifractor plautii]